MTAINLFVVIAFIGTVAMLFGGGVSMIMGGKFDLEHENEFMQGRLFMHAITLGLVVIAIFAWS